MELEIFTSKQPQVADPWSRESAKKSLFFVAIGLFCRFRIYINCREFYKESQCLKKKIPQPIGCTRDMSLNRQSVIQGRI